MCVDRYKEIHWPRSLGNIHWRQMQDFLAWMEESHPEAKTLEEARACMPDWLAEKERSGVTGEALIEAQAAIARVLGVNPEDADFPVNVVCPYCGRRAELIDSSAVYNGESYGKIYLCRPCWAYVGVHRNTYIPLGRLADKDLRRWKRCVHEVFDTLWVNEPNRRLARTNAYKWLADKMGLPVDEAHFGKFDIDQCKKAVQIIQAKQSEMEAGQQNAPAPAALTEPPEYPEAPEVEEDETEEGEERPDWQDEILIHLRDKDHDFSLAMSTILACLEFAILDGELPKLPVAWIKRVEEMYPVEFNPMVCY